LNRHQKGTVVSSSDNSNVDAKEPIRPSPTSTGRLLLLMAQSGEGDCANFFTVVSAASGLPDIFRPALADEFPRPVRIPYDQAATSRSNAGLLWMIKVDPFSSTTSFLLNSDSMRVIDSRLVPVS
jgi:hypothetical protein